MEAAVGIDGGWDEVKLAISNQLRKELMSQCHRSINEITREIPSDRRYDTNFLSRTETGVRAKQPFVIC